MSRNLSFTGARPQPPQPAAWTFQHKIVPIPLASAGPVAIWGTTGPLMVEWCFIEADIYNQTYILFGEKYVQINPNAPTSNNCICTLGPGEYCVFEPNEKTASAIGLITAPDGEIGDYAIAGDLDMIDVTQFWAAAAGAVVNVASLHVTIGNRSRR